MKDEPREVVTLNVAVGMLRIKPGGKVHTFRQAGPVLLGADWGRDQIIEAMRKAEAIDIAGPAARGMGHGLCIYDEQGALFIETQKDHEQVLSMWTLFDSPADAPGWFVLRRCEVGSFGRLVTQDVHASKNVEELRDIMRDMGLYCLGRQEGDEPHIVESWI